MIEDKFEGISEPWRNWVKKNRLVLVTGGSGYVGSKLVPHLLSDGWRVRVMETQIFGNPIADLEGDGCQFVQGDITKVDDCKRAMEGVTDVIHLAGIVTDELVDMNHGKGWAVNVGGTLNLLEIAADMLVSRFIYASSSSVYGTAAQEGIPNEATLPLPQTEYARQKLEAERCVLSYRDFEVVTAVRQATACGPAPRMRLDTIVNILSKQAWFDGVITPDKSDQYRSNVHVADAVEFYRQLLLLDGHLINGRPWNVTMGNMRVGAIAEEVAKAFNIYTGKTAEIKPRDVTDARSYRLSGERASAELGFRPMRTVRDAALDNFDHFRDTNLDPGDDIYFNNRRMAGVMAQEAN